MPRQRKKHADKRHLLPEDYPAWLFVPTREPPGDYQARLMQKPHSPASVAVINLREDE